MLSNIYINFVLENFTKIIFFLTLLIVTSVSGYFYLNQVKVNDSNYSTDTNTQDNYVLPPQKDEKYLHFRPENKLTVINYFSLDCPFCRTLFYAEEEFVKIYGDRVNFAFRDKPLSSNPLSYEKALIKECIYLNNDNSNDKYFQFTKEIFQNYEQELSLQNNRGNNNWVKKRALNYISEEQLNTCLNDEKLKQKILQFRAQADVSQVFWTPTIVLFKDGVEVERIEKVWAQIYQKALERYSK